MLSALPYEDLVQALCNGVDAGKGRAIPREPFCNLNPADAAEAREVQVGDVDTCFVAINHDDRFGQHFAVYEGTVHIEKDGADVADSSHSGFALL